MLPSAVTSRISSSNQPGPSGSDGSVVLRRASRMRSSKACVSPSRTASASSAKPQIALATTASAASTREFASRPEPDRRPPDRIRHLRRRYAAPCGPPMVSGSTVSGSSAARAAVAGGIAVRRHALVSVGGGLPSATHALPAVIRRARARSASIARGRFSMRGERRAQRPAQLHALLRAQECGNRQAAPVRAERQLSARIVDGDAHPVSIETPLAPLPARLHPPYRELRAMQPDELGAAALPIVPAKGQVEQQRRRRPGSRSPARRPRARTPPRSQR